MINNVSIHAPTKGATGFVTLDEKSGKVSIHAPTKGATVAHPPTPPLQYCFNPRTHKGCDKAVPCGKCSLYKFQSTHPQRVRHIRGRILHHPERVSIHAPTKGATDGNLPIEPVKVFQSTHPQRVRPRIPQPLHVPVRCFNPRTHKGCDPVS